MFEEEIITSEFDSQKQRKIPELQHENFQVYEVKRKVETITITTTTTISMTIINTTSHHYYYYYYYYY